MSAGPGSRIGIFGKGGSGKSTVTVFLARALRRAGHAVVVLDADSTNLGLAAALGIDHEPRPLLDHFGGMVFSGGAVTCPVDDPTPLPDADIRLRDLPAEYIGETADGIRLLVAGKLGQLGPGAGCDGPIVKIARDLRVTVADPDPITLVDFKAGFEDAARGAVTSVDWAMVVVDPTSAAVRMAEHLTGMVAAVRKGVPPATAHLGSGALADVAIRLYRDARVQGVRAVLNRTPDADAEVYLRAALERCGVKVAGVFPEDRGVASQWLCGEPLRSLPLDESAGELATTLSESLLGTPGLAPGDAVLAL